MLLNLDTLPKKGETVTFALRGARFDMVIDEARIRYGDIDVRISPVAGQGSFWVRYSSVKKNAQTSIELPEIESPCRDSARNEANLVG